MEFFLSGEIDNRDGEIGNIFSKIQVDLENKLNKELCDRSYGDAVDLIGIIPIIMKFDKVLDERDWFKERILFKKKAKEADVRLRISYEEFVNSTEEKKRLLLVMNIVLSIRRLSDKVKSGLDFYKLENDILEVFNIAR